MPPKRPTKVSGIQTTRDGERVIPASVRADGSIRPERRVKQGYTPVEDVSAYKNEKAETFRTHQYGHKDYVPPGLGKTASNTEQKKRRAKKPGLVGGDELATNSAVEGIGQEDPEKKARALRKKIKAAADLKERADKGDKLEDSQLAKIKMLKVFEKELAAMNLEGSEES
jgi:partner of Y14 and mago